MYLCLGVVDVDGVGPHGDLLDRAVAEVLRELGHIQRRGRHHHLPPKPQEEVASGSGRNEALGQTRSSTGGVGPALALNPESLD